MKTPARILIILFFRSTKSSNQERRFLSSENTATTLRGTSDSESRPSKNQLRCSKKKLNLFEKRQLFEFANLQNISIKYTNLHILQNLDCFWQEKSDRISCLTASDQIVAQVADRAQLRTFPSRISSGSKSCATSARMRKMKREILTLNQCRIR